MVRLTILLTTLVASCSAFAPSLGTFVVCSGSLFMPGVTQQSNCSVAVMDRCMDETGA